MARYMIIVNSYHALPHKRILVHMRMVKGRKNFKYCRHSLFTYAAAHSGAFIAISMASALEHIGKTKAAVSPIKVKIKNPALTFFQVWHNLHAHVNFFV